MKRTLPAVAVLSVLVAAPMQAHAQSETAAIIAAKVATVKQMISSQVAEVTAIANQTTSYLQGLTSSTNSIVSALLDFSSQQTSNNTNALKMQANMADTHDAREVQLRVEQARYDAQKSATSGSSLCNNITGAASTQGLANMVKQWRTGSVQNILAADNGHINGKRGAVSQATMTDIYEGQHCAHSATDSDYQVGRCGHKPGDTPTQEKTAASVGPDGFIAVADDQNADLILNATDLTANQQEAMGRFIQLVSPDFTGQAVVGSQADTEERRRIFHKMDQLRARKSVVHSIVTGLIGTNAVLHSAASNDLQTKASAWAEATAAQVAGYTQTCGTTASTSGGTGCKYFPNGVSANDILALESNYWFYNLTYGIFASAEGQAPSQKDLNEMQAFQMVMDYHRYQTEREIDMSLATILGIMIEQEQEKFNAGQ